MPLAGGSWQWGKPHLWGDFAWQHLTGGSQQETGWRGFSNQALRRSPPMGSKERLDRTNGLLSAGRLWTRPGDIKTSQLSASRCCSLVRSLPPLPWSQPAFLLSRLSCLPLSLPAALPLRPCALAWAAYSQPCCTNPARHCHLCHDPRQGPGPPVRAPTHRGPGAVAVGAAPVRPHFCEACEPCPSTGRQRALAKKGDFAAAWIVAHQTG